MIDLYSINIFVNQLTTLQETSKDTSDKNCHKYMTDSNLRVINFDKVKTNYANSFRCSEDSAKSVDAVYQDVNRIIFIEFKNGKVEPSVVKSKIRDSLDIIGETLKFSRKHIEFILVYNHDKNLSKARMSKTNTQPKESLVKFTKYFSSKADKEFKSFALEKYEGIFFREIHTYTEVEFKNFLDGVIHPRQSRGLDL